MVVSVCKIEPSRPVCTWRIFATDSAMAHMKLKYGHVMMALVLKIRFVLSLCWKNIKKPLVPDKIRKPMHFPFPWLSFHIGQSPTAAWHEKCDKLIIFCYLPLASLPQPRRRHGSEYRVASGFNKNAYQHCVTLHLVLFHWSVYSWHS